jgi:hypothetical protein
MGFIMHPEPRLIDQLRSHFKEGATPSALIRRIAEWHAGESHLDWLVRAYFREAFGIPMIHVGMNQVHHVADGGSLPTFNRYVLANMVEFMLESDSLGSNEGSWFEGLTAKAPAVPDPGTLPELSGSWDRMDDESKRFVRRLIDSSHESHRKVEILAALAERLQQQVNQEAAAVAG